jgi:hypothetical protein
VNLYWIDLTEHARDLVGPGSGRGYGVTAIDKADAVQLLQDHFQRDKIELDTESAIASIRAINDVSEIEQNHVRPNMGFHLRRGVWYPSG